jgi:hypothetical protein
MVRQACPEFTEGLTMTISLQRLLSWHYGSTPQNAVNLAGLRSLRITK